MAKESPQRVALLSIHPRYAKAILEQRKTVEFRKKPLAPDITHVIIYATRPESVLLGYFKIKNQVIDTPKNLWKLRDTKKGIDRKAFFEYYGESKKGVAIHVETVTRFEHPLNLLEALGLYRPPQCMQYLPETVIKTLNTLSRQRTE